VTCLGSLGYFSCSGSGVAEWLLLGKANCDRTTSEMRGLSPKIILGDSR
jgi:hypothetical protein